MTETPVGLVIFLTIIGFLALYWILFGQWKHNRDMRAAEFEAIKKQIKESSKNKKDNKGVGNIKKNNKSK